MGSLEATGCLEGKVRMKQALAAGIAGAAAAVLGVAGLGFLDQLQTPAHLPVDATLAAGETADLASLPA